MRGGLEVHTESERHLVPAGTAFHVPDGLCHRLVVEPRAAVAGFEPIDPAMATDDAGLEAAGWEVVRRHRPGVPTVDVDMAAPRRPAGTGHISTTTRVMGELLFTRAQLGPRSGYTSTYCDLPHWGLVTSGHVAIEWEDDVEVLAEGDLFLCPKGPPGHRIQAPDPATIIDFTPLEAFDGPGRMTEWRRQAMDRERGRRARPKLELVAFR
jgi:quercetin dioxygenase-like cupin family protein